MTTPRWDAFVTAVAAALDDALDIEVFDGPTVSGSDAVAHVIIGGRFDDLDVAAGSFDLEYRTDGGASASMDETLRVNCALRYWGGDSDIAAARSAAFGYLGQINDTLRSNASLGVTALLWAYISTGDVTVDLRQGAQVTVNFTINARAII